MTFWSSLPLAYDELTTDTEIVVTMLSVSDRESPASKKKIEELYGSTILKQKDGSADLKCAQLKSKGVNRSDNNTHRRDYNYVNLLLSPFPAPFFLDLDKSAKFTGVY